MAGLGCTEKASTYLSARTLGLIFDMIFYILFAIVFWASSFVAIRAAIVEFSPIEIAVLRFVTSSIALIPIVIIQKVSLPGKKSVKFFIQIGIVLFINQIMLNYGAQTITAGETTLLVSTSQLFQVLLAYIFLRESLSNRFIFGLFLCFVGVAIIALQNSFRLSLNPGVFFVLIAALTNAIYFIMQKPLLKNFSPLAVVGYSTWITTVFLVPFGDSAIKKLSVSSVNGVFSVVYIGVATVIANVFWSKVLSKMDASKAAVYLYVVPLMTILIGFIWLKELPTALSCLGGVIILAGVILSNFKTQKATKGHNYRH